MTDLSSPPQNDPRMERMENAWYGKYRAVVVDNKDPEQLGRLRLMIPSVFGGVTGEPSPEDPFVTDWAWPCMPCGGKAEQGFFFIPDVGAKVWAEFEEGHLDCPIWVGGFWAKPGKTEIPTEAQKMTKNEPLRRVLKTSTGHYIEFCDEEGKETITIKHKDKALIHFDEKGGVTITNKSGTLIYMNAEDKELAIADENGNNIRLGESNVTLTNKEGAVVDLNGSAVQVVAKNVMVRSQTVALGEGASEPAILGLQFATVYDAHTHMTAMGPSGPPMPVPMPLSAPTHPAMSKVVKLK
ncbi:MAG TPA: phage baseplate assembly protein V [Burkholderiales bacterium]|nr:phage baseplate assembly protein V [Burkholderiales bacterium]